MTLSSLSIKFYSRPWDRRVLYLAVIEFNSCRGCAFVNHNPPPSGCIHSAFLWLIENSWTTSNSLDRCNQIAARCIGTHHAWYQSPIPQVRFLYVKGRARHTCSCEQLLFHSKLNSEKNPDYGCNMSGRSDRSRNSFVGLERTTWVLE